MVCILMVSTVWGGVLEPRSVTHSTVGLESVDEGWEQA